MVPIVGECALVQFAAWAVCGGASLAAIVTERGSSEAGPARAWLCAASRVVGVCGCCGLNTVAISGASFRKISPSPSDVREVRQISVQKLSEVRVCTKMVRTLIMGIVLMCDINNR